MQNYFRIRRTSKIVAFQVVSRCNLLASVITVVVSLFVDFFEEFLPRNHCYCSISSDFTLHIYFVCDITRIMFDCIADLRSIFSDYLL